MTTYEVSYEIEIPEYEVIVVDAVDEAVASKKAQEILEEMYPEALYIEQVGVKEVFV